MDQAGPGAHPFSKPFERLTMRKLGLPHYRNPEAARLAQHYAPQILAVLSKNGTEPSAGPAPSKRSPEMADFAAKLEAAWPKFVAEEAQRNRAGRAHNARENGYQPERELDDEEIQALAELPL